MDFKLYYAAKRKTLEDLQTKFPGNSCLVMPTKAGSFSAVEVTLDNAARLITEASHRLASPAEEQAFRAGQDLQRSRNASVDILTRARQQFGLTPKGGGK